MNRSDYAFGLMEAVLVGSARFLCVCERSMKFVRFGSSGSIRYCTAALAVRRSAAAWPDRK